MDARDQNMAVARGEGASRPSLGVALLNGWVEFWYQPKISLKKRQMVGVELLARVRQPGVGILYPGAFMAASDKSQMVELGEQALITALRTGLKFSRMGMSVCFGVNIPFEVILQLPIPVILRRYRTKDEPWGGLILDIGEQEILDNIPVVCGLASQLAQYNVRFAIDNFGECIAKGGKETIGRVVADLAKLKDVSFAEMKLFPGLVNDCATDPQRSQICRAVISLTHRMNSIAVAVGVEKTADLKTLEDMGCDVGQGFLFGEPMSNQQFTNLMRSRGAKSA